MNTQELEILGVCEGTMLKFAYSTGVEREILNNSNFTAAPIRQGFTPKRVVSIMDSIGDCVISIWEWNSESEAYLLKAHISVDEQQKFQISRKMENGSERRIDLAIVL